MRVKLGDIAILINGDRGKNYPSQNDINTEGGIPFVNAGHLSLNTIDFEGMNYISEAKYESLNSGKFVSGDILYCLRGSLGKKAIVPKATFGAVASSLVIIRPDSEKVLSEYLLLALDSSSIQEQLHKANNGSSQPNLSAASVKQYEFDLPDLDKQREIVDILLKVKSLIELRKNQIFKLNELVKSRFVELFGTPLLNEKGWEVKNSGDVCSVTDGSHFSPVGQETGYPMLSVRNMRNDGFHYDDCKLVSQEDYDILVKQGCKPLKNDVLIAKDGSYFYYGFVVKEEIEQAVLSSIAILRPNLEKINPEYLCRYMLSNEIVDMVGKNYVTGAAIKRVILKGIKQIPVMLPPIELQNQFATFVEQTDKSKVVIQESLRKVEFLFDSLMQKYFGE